MIDRRESSCIVDRYFYESFRKIEEKKSKSLSYYVVRTLALLLAVPINHIILQQGRNEVLSLFTIFLIVTLAYTTLQTCFAAYFFCAYVRNKAKIIKIATEFHHSYLLNDLKSLEPDEVEEDMNLYARQECLGLRVSTVYYDFENMQKFGDVSEQFKTMRESNGCNIIGNALEGSLRCFKFFSTTFMFFSVFVFAFGMTVSSIAPLNETQHSLLEMVLISELMFQPRVYAIMLLLALAPVAMVVVCIYCCCCGGRKAKAKLPDRVKATPECISKCAECSICFQGINVGEEVVVLPCSDMHVFHHTCIEGWTKVKPNCPNCRHILD